MGPPSETFSNAHSSESHFGVSETKRDYMCSAQCFKKFLDTSKSFKSTPKKTKRDSILNGILFVYSGGVKKLYETSSKLDLGKCLPMVSPVFFLSWPILAFAGPGENIPMCRAWHRCSSNRQTLWRRKFGAPTQNKPTI